MSKVKFDVDFFQSIKGVSDLAKGIGKVGNSLDSLQSDSGKIAKGLASDVKKMSAVYDSLAASAEKATKPNQQYIKTLGDLKHIAEATMTSIVAANQKADIAVRAYADSESRVGNILRDTSAKNRAATALDRITGATHSLYLENEVLQSRIKALNSEEGKRNAVLKVQESSLKRIQSEEVRRASASSSVRRELEYLNSAQGKSDTLDKAAVTTKRQIILEDQRRAETTARLTRELEYLRSAEGRANAALRQRIAEERKLLSDSTESQKKSNINRKIGAQLTSSMRAGLQGLQSSIGMYTSSTIIAAATTYALVRSFKNMIEVGAQFQATMARTQAIMSNGIPSEFRGEMFDSVGKSIRALGMSTQFTASEVAGAVTELGQAGLSTGQAMIALKPTLDLAIIGGIDMAKAADHATNIMMIFGKEATDLSGIVDTMAVAVTNSNTNVNQLANALTYAGPAAETMGISITETTAAIAALANSGFKASRAGTALRRLFVSLANPTAKGQKVLDQFGISVTDLEGRTRNLTSIVKDLNSAMVGMQDTDKLAAIQNLVGVYAASPVAALVNQVANMEDLEYQLKNNANAAKDMRTQIEAALLFDYKTALSAFQEVQLTIFDTLEDRLKLITIKTAEALSGLVLPYEDNDEGITNIEVYLSRMGDLVSILGIAGSSLLAFKMASGTGFLANFSTGLKATQLSLFNYHAATSRSILSTQQLNLATKSMSLTMGVATRALNLYQIAMSSLSRAAYLLSGALNTIAVAARFLMSALGWVGLLYGLYTAFDMFFGDSSVDKIKRQKEEVDVLAASYLEVKTNIQKAAEAKEKSEAGVQLKLQNRMRDQLLRERSAWEKTREIQAMTGGSTREADIEISAIDRRLEGVNATITSLENLTAVENAHWKDSQSTMQKRIRLTEEMNRVASGQEKIWMQTGYRNMTKGEIDTRLDTLREELLGLPSAAGEAQIALSQIVDGIEKYNSAQESAREGRAFDLGLTDINKMMIAYSQLNAAQNAYQKQLDSMKGITPSFSDAEKLEGLAKIVQSRLDNIAKLKEGVESFDSLKATLSKELKFSSMSDEEKNLSIQKDFVKVQKERISIESLLNTELAENAKLVLQDRWVTLVEEEIKLKNSLIKVNKNLNDKNKELFKEEWAAYQKLLKQLDPVLFAKQDLLKVEKQLTALRSDAAAKEGKGITSEQEIRALLQARKNFIEIEDASDKSLQSWLALKGQDSSPFEKSVKDLWEINKLIEEAKKKVEANPTDANSRDLKAKQDYKDRLLAKDPVEPNWEGMSPQNGLGASTLTSLIGKSQSAWGFDRENDAVVRDLDAGISSIQTTADKSIEDVGRKYDPILAAETNAARLKEIEAQKNLEIQGLQDKANEQKLIAAQMAGDALVEISERSAQQQRQANMMVVASAASDLSSMLMMVVDANDQFTSGQKAAFIAAKALAISSILIQTHVGAANARAIPGVGEGMASLILAQGYASAALVGSMAIGEYKSKKESSKSGGDSNYAGAYDKGGYIPTGQYGIVGEYGPEIVNGPAHVTGREATAKKLGGSGGDNNISIPITVNYQSDSGATDSDKDKDARLVSNTIKAVVLQTMQNELRPNGMLHKR